MDPQLSLFGGPGDDLDGIEYDLAFILANPIPAVCTKGKHHMCRNRREDIHAPQLDNVRCFWCGGPMAPLDPPAYRERLATLWQHISRTL